MSASAMNSVSVQRVRPAVLFIQAASSAVGPAMLGLAAAFLRLGILYGRQQNLESAQEAFKEAEDIYVSS